MASISAMISLVVIFLATYAYSVPVVSDLQNATSTMQVENATVDFSLENIVILARRDTSDEKRVNDSVGLSSSSSEDETYRTGETTDRPSSRSFEDTSFPSSSETNEKREVGTDANESFDDDENERSFTEDSLSTEVNTKRGIEVESFESSTVEETSVEPSSRVKNVKRSLDDGQWLADSGSWSSIQSNEQAERKKRSSDNGQWLGDESNNEAQKRSYEDMQFSTDDSERSAVEETSVPSTSEVTNTRYGMEQSASFPAAQNEQFKQRTSGVVSQPNQIPQNKRGMEQSSSFLAGQDEQFNQRTSGVVRQPKQILQNEGDMQQSSSFPAGQNGQFNQRTSGVVSQPNQIPQNKRDMQQPSFFSDQASMDFNRRAIGPVEVEESSTIVAAKIYLKLTTDEEPSSSTEFARDEASSTSEYETTEVPVEHYTSSTGAPSTSTGKILAVIPGKISRSQLIVDPATGTTAGFRPAKQVRLTQGQNQTFSEERKPDY